MDERRLAELFKDAADDAARQAPPAAFDHADVLAGSRRAAQLRRRRLAGGASAVVVVAAAVAGLAGAGAFGTSGGTSSTLAGPAPAIASEQPSEPRPRSARPPEAMPYGAPVPAPAPPGVLAEPKAPSPQPDRAMPFGAQSRSAPTRCVSPDAELFAQLTAVLPAVRGATPRPLACPPGGRGVEVDVDDNGARGVLRVVYAPPGSGGVGASRQGAGAVATAAARTRDGGEVSVTSISAGPGRAPFGDRLDRVSSDLANRR